MEGGGGRWVQVFCHRWEYVRRDGFLMERLIQIAMPQRLFQVARQNRRENGSEEKSNVPKAVKRWQSYLIKVRTPILPAANVFISTGIGSLNITTFSMYNLLKSSRSRSCIPLPMNEFILRSRALSPFAAAALELHNFSVFDQRNCSLDFFRTMSQPLHGLFSVHGLELVIAMATL